MNLFLWLSAKKRKLALDNLRILKTTKVMKKENYFDFDSVAERYKNGRPDIHIAVVKRLQEILKIQSKLNLTIDVGCGTGLFAKSLLQISKNIIGLDNSSGMLKHAYHHQNISYYQKNAENVGSINQQADLITVSSAFHWFRQTEFLKSTKIILPVGNKIIIHNNFFTSTTDDKESESFHTWMKTRYLEKFKTPKRNKFPLVDGELEDLGYKEIINERFDNKVLMNKKNLIDYLITQSNVVLNVEMGRISLNKTIEWLEFELDEHFKKMEKRNFIFGNRLIILERCF